MRIPGSRPFMRRGAWPRSVTWGRRPRPRTPRRPRPERLGFERRRPNALGFERRRPNAPSTHEDGAGADAGPRISCGERHAPGQIEKTPPRGPAREDLGAADLG